MAPSNLGNMEPLEIYNLPIIYFASKVVNLILRKGIQTNFGTFQNTFKILNGWNKLIFYRGGLR